MRKVALPMLILVMSGCFPATASISCESLTGLKLPDTTITLASVVGTGEFSPPAEVGRGRPGAFKDLPAFCRVAATLRPSSDSDIKIEVWLPVSGWNGKFQAVGNGGWSGAIVYRDLSQALLRGYATSSTDTGHNGDGADASFALGQPEKVIDFGYRAVHEMTVKAKAIVTAYYDQVPRLSYWNGCSSGGKQGLKEAQRFPADYDGIIAGAPANNWTHLMTGIVWAAQATNKDQPGNMPPQTLRLLHDSVLQACDALDGVKDGVLEDPRQCKFDPKVLECKGVDGSGCLTASQVAAARKMYGPAVNPRTKQTIYPGMAPGSELGWDPVRGLQPLPIAVSHFQNIVFQKTSWDYRDLNFDTDVALADRIDGRVINATDPNLKPFFDYGGKLIQYHGWNDQQISPLNSIDYFQSVQDALGGASHIADSYELFMAPGMNHCRAGDGPNTFDMVGALEQWVEKDRKPDQILASRVTDGKVDRTRLLCPYPQVAKFKGQGSTDEAVNFACAMP
jgi:feruloyl esterase